jgi:hypothetical protein
MSAGEVGWCGPCPWTFENGRLMGAFSRRIRKRAYFAFSAIGRRGNSNSIHAGGMT